MEDKNDGRMGQNLIGLELVQATSQYDLGTDATGRIRVIPSENRKPLGIGQYLTMGRSNDFYGD